MEQNDILLVNEMAGYGKIGLPAMIPVLSAYGHRITNLPTALVSNALDRDRVEILDTTDYMEKTIDVWNAEDIRFDSICTGYLVNERQVDLLETLLKQNPKAKIVVDPIMGGDGRLYKGVKAEVVEQMRKLIPLSDVLLPNLTEAELLVYGKVRPEKHDFDYYRNLLERLQGMGAKSVIMSSVEYHDRHYVYCCNEDTKFNLEYKHWDTQIPGTGDVFTAVLLANLIKGEALEDAVEKTTNFVSNAVKEHQDTEDPHRGLNIEKYLHKLIKE